METILSLLLGLGLSAACGFRVFVPLLVVSIAAVSGHITLAKDFAWIGSEPALLTFAVATVLEVAAYYVPWLDNFLDSIATPAAVVAGTVVTASVVTDMSPLLRWTLAIVAGGGTAALVQGGTVLARGASTVASGGIANPLLASVEMGGAVTTSVVSVLAPALGAALVLALVAVAGGCWFYHARSSRGAKAALAPSNTTPPVLRPPNDRASLSLAR